MMKGMVESGARAGIKETYKEYKEVSACLCRHFIYFSCFATQVLRLFSSYVRTESLGTSKYFLAFLYRS